VHGLGSLQILKPGVVALIDGVTVMIGKKRANKEGQQERGRERNRVVIKTSILFWHITGKKGKVRMRASKRGD